MNRVGNPNLTGTDPGPQSTSKLASTSANSVESSLVINKKKSNMNRKTITGLDPVYQNNIRRNKSIHTLSSSSELNQQDLSKDELALLAEFSLPISNPTLKPPSRELVFVDPDDSHTLFWWPAMVVPNSEIDSFFKALNTPTPPKPGSSEYLVCYFEDGSYSVVSRKDTKPFSPFEGLYVDYLNGPHSSAFVKDKAAVLASMYWELGNVPHYFTWLQFMPREDRSSAPKLYPELSDTGSSKRVRDYSSHLVVETSLAKKAKTEPSTNSHSATLPRSPISASDSTSSKQSIIPSKSIFPYTAPIIPSPERSTINHDSESETGSVKSLLYTKRPVPIKLAKMNKKKRWMSQYISEHPGFS